MRNKQSGLSLIGTLIVGAILAFLFVLGFRCVPVVNEYFSVKKIMNQIVDSGFGPDVPPAQIRSEFNNRAAADYVDKVTGNDLVISRQNGNLQLSIAYERTVPIAGNVSLLFEFDATVGGS